ncbi:MAG: DUF6801 domain-containing protein [Labedaea sp.]
MNHRRIPRRLTAALTAAGTAGIVVAGLLVGSGNSFAEPRTLVLQYNCTFPLIGPQNVTVTISADIPTTVQAGTPTEPFVVNAVADSGPNATAGLVLVGATTIEGFADTGTHLTGPGVDLDLTVPATIPVQPVPPQGQSLILNAQGTSPAVTFPQAGTAQINIGALSLRALHPRNASGGDTGLGVFDAPCTQAPGQNTLLATIQVTSAADTEAPSAPGNARSTGVTTDSVALAWDAAADNVGVTGYDVFNGSTLATSVTGTSATVTGLTPDTAYTFTVKAKDAAGNSSAASNTVSARTEASPTDSPPSAPANLRSTGTTQNSVSLAWDAATDDHGVTGYDVFNGSTLATSVTGTSATVTGLTPGTAYTFTVKAKDTANQSSAASNAVAVTTDAPPSSDVPISFNLSGSTMIKAVHGTVPLSGSVDAQINLSTGAFGADLTLNPTTGRFTILGFVPVTAQIEFVQAARTTGTFSGGVLASTSSETIKLPRVSVLGFPIAGGPNCQTRTPASIPLMSGPNFDPLAGGRLTGTYTIPALRGCGALNGVVSALTTGPNNTIDVNLTPKPAARQARR